MGSDSMSADTIQSMSLMWNTVATLNAIYRTSDV